MHPSVKSLVETALENTQQHLKDGQRELEWSEDALKKTKARIKALEADIAIFEKALNE